MLHKGSDALNLIRFNQLKEIKVLSYIHVVMTFKLKKDVYFSNKKIWLCNLQRVSAFDARGLSYLPTQIRFYIYLSKLIMRCSNSDIQKLMWGAVQDSLSISRKKLAISACEHKELSCEPSLECCHRQPESRLWGV